MLRKEPADVEGRPARPEAAEAVFGEWAEATEGGRMPPGIMEPEQGEAVMPTPKAGSPVVRLRRR